MYFRLDFLVRDLMLPRDSQVEFHFAGPHRIASRLWYPTADEQHMGYKFTDTKGCVTSDREPNPAVLAMFEGLSEGRMLEGCTLDSSWMGYIYNDDGSLMPNQMPPPKDMPVPFQSFAADIDGELWQYARRTVQVLRWRFAIEGPDNPFGSSGVTWTLDGETWRFLPAIGRVVLSASPYLPRLSDDDYLEVKQYILDGCSEPLGHELFREAWEQRLRNPRSALVMGIAALEIGFKTCVATLLPDARWLVEKLPSPDVITMLREYLPRLPAKLLIDGKVQPPNAELLATLRKGRDARNLVSHQGNASLTPDTLDEILWAVRDVLWLLDYYCGFTWALKHVRDETLAALRQAK